MRMVFGRLFPRLFLFLILIPSAGFPIQECPFLIATSITETGGGTVALLQHGELHFIEDFQNRQTQQPEWVYTTHPTALPRVAREGMVRTGLLTDLDAHNGVWFLSQSIDGSSHVVSPNGLAFQIVDSNENSPRVAAFYRPDVHYYLEQAERSGLGKPAAEDLRNNPFMLPAELWTVQGDSVYRSTLRLQNIPDDDEVTEALRNIRWPVRFQRTALSYLGGLALTPMDGLMQISTNEEVETWLPTSDEKIVARVSAARKVVTPSLRAGIDFLHVLSPRRVVVANELGEFQVWNQETGERVAEPSMNNAVWLRQTTAYLNSGKVEILALHMDGSVYRWNENFGTPWFKVVPAEELPPTSSPIVGISAASQIVPDTGTTAEHPPAWIRYSLYSGLPIRVHRVLVATDDGTLYGTSPGSPFQVAEAGLWLPYRVPRQSSPTQQ